MTKKLKLTKTAIAALPAGTHWDAEVPGLACRVGKSGTRGFVVKYRVGRGREGTIRWYALGSTSIMTPDQAREMARDVIRRGRMGEDVQATVKAEQEAAERAEARKVTIARLADLYIAERKRKGRSEKTIYDYQCRIDRTIKPELGDIEVGQLTRQDVREVTQRIADAGKPYEANRVLTLLGAMMNFAEAEDLIASTPLSSAVVGSLKATEKKRERYLSDDEIRWFWFATGELQAGRRALYRLLLLTGQRRGEVASMAEADVDLEAAEWIQRTNKTDQTHLVPLSAPVVAELSQLEPANGWVFPSRQGQHFEAQGGDTKLDNAIRARMGELAAAEGKTVEHFTMHGLRHTVKTGMAKMGISPEVRAAVQNHARGGIDSTYNHYDLAKEKRAALDAWAARVLEIAGEAPAADNVVRLA